MNNSVIDLTDSFTLVDHCNLNNVIIDLASEEETSFLGGRNIVRHNPPTPQSTRKRRISKPAPDKNKKQPKKSRKKKETPDEPEAKKPRQEESQLGSCPICLDEFGTKPLASTKCGHVFCLSCLKVALKSEAKCPNCRTKLKGASAYHPLYLS